MFDLDGPYKEGVEAGRYAEGSESSGGGIISEAGSQDNQCATDDAMGSFSPKPNSWHSPLPLGMFNITYAPPKILTVKLIWVPIVIVCIPIIIILHEMAQ